MALVDEASSEPTLNLLHNFDHNLIDLFGHVPCIPTYVENGISVQKQLHKLLFVNNDVVLDIFDVAVGIIHIVARKTDGQLAQNLGSLEGFEFTSENRSHFYK